MEAAFPAPAPAAARRNYKLPASVKLPAMNERSCRRLSAGCGALSLLLLAAVLRRPSASIEAAAAVAVCCAVLLYAWLQIHKAVQRSVLHALDVPPPPRFSIRPIADAAELRAVWEINADLYGSDALPFDAYLSWWRAYPKAVLALMHEQRIVGAITIWPVLRGAFKRLLGGAWALRSSDFYPPHAVSKCRDFYVSGIVVRPEFRLPEALRALMCRAMLECVLIAREQFSANVCAVASSAHGAALLERFGFVRRGETEQGFPTYCLLGVGPLLLRRMSGAILAYRGRRSRPHYAA